MIVNLFELFWYMADQAREEGDPKRAIELYRKACAQIGLDFDAFCAEHKREGKRSKLTEVQPPQPASIA